MSDSSVSTILPHLDIALALRQAALEEHAGGVLRLFNGFYEGCPDLVVDYYAHSLVLYNYSKEPSQDQYFLFDVQAYYLQKLPFLDCVIQKVRYAKDLDQRRGWISFGTHPATMVEEFGVRYALDLRLNQDASFYPDTRNLRSWLLQNSQGRSVLNLFAYTGSLGVATLVGGASSVSQVDLNRNFLELAQRSLKLNNLDPLKMTLQTIDFFSQVATYKRQASLFDLLILDAPFFTSTRKGSFNLAQETVRLVNKVRPLVANDGRLVVVNNALYLSGAVFLQQIKDLCKDGYLSIQETIGIPEDITGYPETVKRKAPVDPAPFNHPTKIIILGVKRK